jgi:membrane-associated phospholipid phosphatase
MLAYFAVLTLRSWRARTAAVFSAAVLVILIGFSRMYLGVHYFSDVVAGYAAGGVWLSALITGAETIRRSKPRSEQALDESPGKHLPRASG